MNWKLIVLLVIGFINAAYSQTKKQSIRYRANVRDSSLAAFIIGVEGAYQFPMADLKKTIWQ